MITAAASLAATNAGAARSSISAGAGHLEDRVGNLGGCRGMNRIRWTVLKVRGGCGRGGGILVESGILASIKLFTTKKCLCTNPSLEHIAPFTPLHHAVPAIARSGPGPRTRVELSQSKILLQTGLPRRTIKPEVSSSAKVLDCSGEQVPDRTYDQTGPIHICRTWTWH